MKKILLSAAMMVAAVSFASAQWFVGGNVGFETSKKEFLTIPVDGILGLVDVQIGTDVNLPLDILLEGAELKSTSYKILPKFGYIFNDNWMVGLGLGYSSATTKVKSGEELVKLTPNMFMVNPYVRYTAWRVGKFSLAFQGDLNYGQGDTKVKLMGEQIMKIKDMEYGVNIAPIVQFDLTCNVMFESRFNFASLGYNYGQTKWNGEKYKNSEFGFGVDANNSFNTGDIEVGFIVKF